jgi:glycosyltransferase involved in cell wall biosynthesis
LSTGKPSYIISLKFAPGLKKEFETLGKYISKIGPSVIYLLSKKYSAFENTHDENFYITKADNISGMILETLKYGWDKNILPFFQKNPPGFLCFYNPHPVNPLIARVVKKHFPEAILSLYLHDPYKPDKKPYGLVKSTYITMVEFIQRLTVRYMDYVISPSEYSSLLFKKKYPKYKGQNFIAPLLVPDQKISTSNNRKFFSIVGGAHKATGHDTFIELVNYAGEKGLSFEFALISSSNVSMFTKNLTEEGRSRLKVINKNSITDAEINEVIRQSWAVFRLDREVTQSGVLPVAYMNETPVIARDIPGLRQHVKHEYNGYIIPFNCTPEDLTKAMEYVKENFTVLSENARKSYKDIWAEWNFEKYYGWVVDLLKKVNKEQVIGGR